MIHMSSKKIDDFEAYRIFLAMKSHFNNDYDYEKARTWYGGISIIIFKSSI